MRRNYKRKKFHVSGICIFLVLIIFSVAFVLWAMKPDNFRNEKNKINSWLNGISFQDFYNAKSLILVDLSNDNIFISKRENEQQLPASNENEAPKSGASCFYYFTEETDCRCLSQ